MKYAPSANTRTKLTTLKAALACLCVSLAASASALTIEGVRFEDQIRIGNDAIQVNGGGVRYAVGNLVKVYAAVLYAPNKFKTAAEFKAMRGARRLHIIMMRDTDANELGRAMMRGIRNNLTNDEQLKHIDGITRMGTIFGIVPQIKKGEAITVDCIPGKGVEIHIAGKLMESPSRDTEFFDAMSAIWIGPKPVDVNLKLGLLGQSVEKPAATIESKN